MFRRVSCLSVAVAALGGCGGGGSSAPTPIIVTPSPTPTPIPTPSPTPTPTPSPGSTTLLNLTATTALLGYSSSVGSFRSADGLVTSVQDSSITAGSPVRYDQPSGTFVFKSYQFIIPSLSGPNDVPLFKDPDHSTPTFTEATGQSGLTSYRFTQLVIGPTNPTLPLLYSSVAIVRAKYDDGSGQVRYGVTPMAFGLPFNFDTTTLAGQATYNGILVGIARGVGGKNVYDVSGSFQFRVNYDTTAFSGEVHLTGRNDVTGEVLDFGTFPFASTSLRGELDEFGTQIGGSGTFRASLTGPLGEELMAAIDLTLPDPAATSVTLRLSGMLAGKK